MTERLNGPGDPTNTVIYPLDDLLHGNLLSLPKGWLIWTTLTTFGTIRAFGWTAPDTRGRRSIDWSPLAFALAQLRFFTLVSFLVWCGFVTQFLRAQASDATGGFPRQYMRRCAFSGLIGVVHTVLLPEGSILPYAVTGLLRLGLRCARPEVLLFGGSGCRWSRPRLWC